MEQQQKKNKKFANILSIILTYIFLAICIFVVVVTIVSKRSGDGTTEVFGYQLRLVITDSMDKNDLTDVSQFEINSIPKRSLVFVKVMPEENEDEWYRSLKVGDVLTFKYVYVTQETITHRIIDIQEKSSGGFIITLEGDNKNSETGQLKQVIDTSIPNNMNYVIGKVVGKSFVLGFILSLTKEPLWLALIIIIPCIIIMFIEIGKIISILRQNRRDQAIEEKEKEKEKNMELSNELEELRRQLEELKNQRRD